VQTQEQGHKNGGEKKSLYPAKKDHTCNRTKRHWAGRPATDTPHPFYFSFVILVFAIDPVSHRIAFDGLTLPSANGNPLERAVTDSLISGEITIVLSPRLRIGNPRMRQLSWPEI
jgi:hypothetical protein